MLSIQRSSEPDRAHGVAPGDTRFSLSMLSTLEIQPSWRVLDIACGAGRTSAAIAQSFGCSVDLLDSSFSQIQRARLIHGVNPKSEARFHNIEFSKFVIDIHNEGRKFDLVLSEGGFPTYIGFREFLRRVLPITSDGAVVAFSGITTVGKSMAFDKTADFAGTIPERVHRFYSNSVMSDTSKEILSEVEVLNIANEHGLDHVISANMPSRYWQQFYESIAASSIEDETNWREDESFKQTAALYEAFYNSDGRHYMNYSYHVFKRTEETGG